MTGNGTESLAGPVIVRTNDAEPSLLLPGAHSHNARRRAREQAQKGSSLKRLRLLLLISGIFALGYYGYVRLSQVVYQAYENQAFDRAIARSPAAGSVPRPAEGSVLGRVVIHRLNLSAIVREGVDAQTLSIAVGHVSSTSLPGQAGNLVIAAHRDTLFRGLKDIEVGDLVVLETTQATYTYQVAGTRIVKPTDVSVLRADGGAMTASRRNADLLTMITCYPFYYVGSAPERFIVQAVLISQTPAARTANLGV